LSEIGAILKARIGLTAFPIYVGGAAERQAVGPLVQLQPTCRKAPPVYTTSSISAPSNSERFKLTMTAPTPQRPVLELRVALTSNAYDRLVEFYCIGLGLEPAQLWTSDQDRAVILNMGKATLELFDEPHAAAIDQIEVGSRVSGPIRFALQVPDLHAALERLLAHGATLIHPPIVTPWGHHNVRLQDPDGLQITLFQVLDQAE
jgi:uncharacterized glyoxalase superfamily protein PhnB